VFEQTVMRAETLRCTAVEAVERRAQTLAVLPQRGGIVGAIVLKNLPALCLFVEQGDGQARIRQRWAMACNCSLSTTGRRIRLQVRRWSLICPARA
jgi:hypothetical protein